jgi:hypothetical protein
LSDCLFVSSGHLKNAPINHPGIGCIWLQGHRLLRRTQGIGVSSCGPQLDVNSCVTGINAPVLRIDLSCLVISRLGLRDLAAVTKQVPNRNVRFNIARVKLGCPAPQFQRLAFASTHGMDLGMSKNEHGGGPVARRTLATGEVSFALAYCYFNLPLAEC